jgi:hypothetical protein
MDEGRLPATYDSLFQFNPISDHLIPLWAGVFRRNHHTKQKIVELPGLLWIYLTIKLLICTLQDGFGVLYDWVVSGLWVSLDIALLTTY